MSENQSEEGLDDFLNIFIPMGDEEMGLTENGANMTHTLEDNRQPLTTAQRQHLRALDAALGHEPEGQGLSSQVLQGPPNATGQAEPSLPLHSPSNREVEYPTNFFPGQASSVLPSSNLPDSQQAAGNRSEQNLPISGLAQASSTLPQSSLPGQKTTHGSLQLPCGLSLEQANLILQEVALRAHLQNTPDGEVQRPPNNTLVQVSSGLPVSSPPNIQYAEMNRSVQNPQNLRTGSATVNNSLVQNLGNRSPPHVSIPSRGQECVDTHDQEADLNVPDDARSILEDDNLSRPLGELSQLDEVHRINEVHEGVIERSGAVPNDTLERMRNATREANLVTHHDGTHIQQGSSGGQVQQDVTTRNSGPGIPISSSEMNSQTGAMNQPETSTVKHTLNAAVQLLNQYNAPVLPQGPLETNKNSAHSIPLSSIEMNTQRDAMPETSAQPYMSAESKLLNQLRAPILPQIPVGMNNQIGLPQQPSTGTHQPTFDNARTLQDEGNPLPTSLLPSRSNNQARFENSPHILADQRTLNSAYIQSDSLPELELSPSGSDVNAGGIESERELGAVSHSEQHSTALQWISNFVEAASPPFITTLNELDNEESLAVPDVQNHPPGPPPQAVLQGVPSEQHPTSLEEANVPEFRKLLGSTYAKVFGRESDPRVKFSAQFTRMRSENTSHNEISDAIAVPELPLLDEEMVLNSKYTGSDTVRWRAEESNSPTITRITSATRQSAQGTVVPVETLFNHLFCLFRRSFLQREERVHLELTTLFLKSSRLEGETECENDVKGLIGWLERTFTPGHLAKLVQRLVVAIDDSPAMKFLVDRATRKYNPRNTEMTVLGAFYELMSKQHDIMKMNQVLAKRKQEVEKSIRQAKKRLVSKKIKAPKTTYEKKKTRNNEPHAEMDYALIRTFNATKWMVVECTDSHYAYAQSVLEAAKLARSETQTERDETLEILNRGISSSETRNETLERRDSLAEMKEEREQVLQRDTSAVESTVLESFVETMLSLGKVTVGTLLRTIGKLPSRLALTLEAAGEEIEKVRGMGGGEKPGVEDVVRVAHLVDQEKEKNVKQRRIVQKKISYLEECQQLLPVVVEPAVVEPGVVEPGGVEPGGAPA